jgi:hypothetical protein
MMDDEHEYRRKNDVIVTKLQTTLDDFVQRYERDMELQNSDLSKILLTIKSHDEFIRDIKPVYAKGMMALGAAALGTVGICVHWFWGHVKWG